MANNRGMLPRLLEIRRRLYAMADPTPEFFAYTRDFGLDHKVIQAHAGLFTVTLAKFWRDDDDQWIFDFDASGVPAAVTEAILFDQSREPYVGDLVAWPLHDPLAFATAMGTGGGADVLGAINMPKRGKTPLYIHRTPLAWLQAGCQGCVPLKEAKFQEWLEKAGGPFVASSLADGYWLRNLLGSGAPRHRILVALEDEEAA